MPVWGQLLRARMVLPAVLGFALCLVPALLAAPTTTLHPPKTGKIVEGLSAGGLEISASYDDMVAVRGKPDTYCRARHDLGVRYSELVCDWYLPRHESSGTLQVVLAPVSGYGTVTNATKVAQILVFDRKSDPSYRWKPVFTGWRTASGLGLRSTVAAVRKVYGSRLHDYPHPEPLPAGYGTPDGYVVTRHGGRRWVTSFLLERDLAGGRDRVDGVLIQSVDSFARFCQCKPGAS